MNGIESGSPQLQKTVLPVEADANVSIRLAPGQAVEEIAPALERLLREAAPDGAELEIELWSSSPPGLVPPEATAIQLGLDAFERASAAPGAHPFGRLAADRPGARRQGIPTVITGFGLPDSNVHSPNERLVADYVPLGIAAARELYLELAKL